MSERIKIAQDVDECIFNSVKKHNIELNALYQGEGIAELPTYAEVCDAGGTHGAYANYPNYWEINEEMRNAEWFNRGQELIPGARSALNLLEGMLAIYLTTRPETLTEVTREELLENGLPDREVVCRPLAIPLKHTSEWKLDVLRSLVKQGGKAIMIDDSKSMNTTIKENGDPQIESILFAGPMTAKGNGEQNWKQIVRKLLR